MSATADDRASQEAHQSQIYENQRLIKQVNHKTETIRKLNDDFRQSLTGGTLLITPGVQALPSVTRSAALILLVSYKVFTPDNDPHGEHDFGAFEVSGEKLFWKIDYYAPDMLHGSEDPADPAKTKRVLTLMLASEY